MVSTTTVIIWFIAGWMLLISVFIFYIFGFGLAEANPPNCYRIFATPENALDHCGPSTGKGVFFGEICFEPSGIDWHFDYIGGEMRKFPTLLYIAGPATEFAANHGTFNANITGLFWNLGTAPLIGPESGEMKGEAPMSEEIAFHLLNKPNKFVIVATDDTHDGETCDWVSWISPTPVKQ